MSLSPPVGDLDWARQKVMDLPVRAKADPGAAFEPDTLRALACLERHDRAEWSRIRKGLQKAHVLMKHLTAAMQDARRQGSTEESESITHSGLAGQMVPGCPMTEQEIPYPFYLEEGSVQKMITEAEARGGSALVAHAPIVLLGFLKDIDEGVEYLHLAWKQSGHWLDLIVERGKVMSTRKITELASFGFPVTEPQARDIVTYIGALEALNRDRLPTGRVTSHLGWQGDHGDAGFLWGTELILPDGSRRAPGTPGVVRAGDDITFRAQAPGDDQLAAGFIESGSFEEWRNLTGLIAPFPLVRAALYTAFVPPMLDILQVSNFLVDLANRTSTGKTSTLRISGSVWGNPDERQANSVVGSWDVTRVFAERASYVLSSLPVILDDTKRARKPEIVADLIYAMANGRGRGRGNIKSLASTRAWRTVVLSSGEAPATSFTQDGGTPRMATSNSPTCGRVKLLHPGGGTGAC